MSQKTLLLRQPVYGDCGKAFRRVLHGPLISQSNAPASICLNSDTVAAVI